MMIIKKTFKTIKRFINLLSALGISTLYLFSSNVMAIEEPKFELLAKDQAFELRAYAPKIIAEVEIDAEMSEASSKGFRLIADFIFGNNIAQSGQSEKISMTAPVAIKPTSEKVSMTAPVSLQQSKFGWKVHFVMPSQYTMDTLPKPNNPKIHVKEIPAQKFAVIRFSGLVDKEKFDAKLLELNQWLVQKNLKALSSPELARYNPPWTLPFLRRNELMVAVE